MEITNTQYKVIAGSPAEIETQINALMAEGYDVYGAPKIADDGDMVQVVVKKELLSKAEAAKRFGTPDYQAEQAAKAAAAVPKPAATAAAKSPQPPPQQRRPWQEPARVPVRPVIAGAQR